MSFAAASIIVPGRLDVLRLLLYMLKVLRLLYYRSLLNDLTLNSTV